MNHDACYDYRYAFEIGFEIGIKVSGDCFSQMLLKETGVDFSHRES
jgi:hypothetical protein